MKKLKLNIPYDLNKETIFDIFHTDSVTMEKIGAEIHKHIKKDPSINKAVEFCVTKYKDIELVVALMLIVNICFVDYHMQQEMDLAFKMMSNGVRMPREMM